MSWSITNIKNEVIVNAKIARELYNCEDAEVHYTWCQSDEITDKELMDYFVAYKDDRDKKHHLYFNGDHDEHMDFVSEECIQDILKKYKVKGDICFLSADGDNCGTAWGYRFDGKGGMVKLKGSIVFVPEDEQNAS